MIRGLYTAASGMLTAMRRMEFVTNNVANAQTTGYKQERTASSTFDLALLLEQANLSPAQAIGQLGMAALSEEPLLDFTQGALQESGRSLDMALEGPGFFTVQGVDGSIRYTRDGGFTRDALGRLTTSEGDVVLGENGPIEVPPGRLTVEVDGTLGVDGQPIDRLQIVEFGLDQPLRKVGNNQFVPRTDGDAPQASADTRVIQNFIEMSNVDMGGAQTTMLELQRAYEANQRLIQTQDELVARAVNDIARPVS
ncbi:MAG: flagellar hook-basal body protein [Chloroflexi bacterium]|nr:flagellar hook-basal body protein [Chloroflexota bacterium]